MLKNILRLHKSAAGSGFHLPFAPHIAVMFPAGTNPGLHLKTISAPSSVFWYAPMEPLSGLMGLPQLTEIAMQNRNFSILSRKRSAVEVATVCTSVAELFWVSCALNRPLEHIHQRITFDPSYCYCSTWANS